MRWLKVKSTDVKDAIQQFIGVLKTALTGPLPPIEMEFSESVLESDRRVRLFGYWLVAVIFGGFGSWAAFAPLESAAIGRGLVEVKGATKAVQHFEGGIVAEIFVSNGDYVGEGEALIQLDPTLAQSEQSRIQGKLWVARALVDRLVSERDEHAEVEFQSWLLEASDERAQSALLSERALFAARRATQLGEEAVLEQQISQLRSQKEGLLTVLTEKEKVANSLRVEADELGELLSEGYVDKRRILELDRALAQTLGELAELNAAAAATDVAIDEAELKILQLNKRFKTEVVDSLAAAQEMLYDMQQRLLATSDRLARTLITAPTSGYVLGLKANVKGAVISPGEELLEVVPDVDALVIDARMSPMDIDRIRIGQEAEVRFAVFKDAYTITGVLEKISADSVVDESTGEQYFEAKVVLLEEDLTLLGDYQLVPGMPAEVVVKTGTRTFIGYLTSPLNRMFENSLSQE